MSFYCARRLRRKLGTPMPRPRLPRNHREALEFQAQHLRLGGDQHPLVEAAIGRFVTERTRP